MMDEKDSPTFQLGKDDESPEALLHEELQELKIEKLSHRVTLLTILIPCMIGIILIIAYLDIKDRVTQTHDTGAIGVQKLSKDLESKFSSLSLEQAKIRDIHAKKIPALEKSTAFLQSRLKTIQSSLKKLESSAIGRDELSPMIESLNSKYQVGTETIENMQTEFENLKDMDKQIAADVESVSKNLHTLSRTLTEMKTALDGLGQDISALSNLTEEKIGKKELDLALKLKEIGNRQEMLDIKTSLDKKLDVLRKQLQKLESNQDQTGIPQASAPEKKEEPVKTEPGVTATAPSSDQSGDQSTTPSPSDDGGIQEQNIE
jgi:chromosome segregation ATPase